MPSSKTEATLLYCSPNTEIVSSRTSTLLTSASFSFLILCPLYSTPYSLSPLPLDHHLPLTDDLAIGDKNINVWAISQFNAIVIDGVPGANGRKAGCIRIDFCLEDNSSYDTVKYELRLNRTFWQVKPEDTTCGRNRVGAE